MKLALIQGELSWGNVTENLYRFGQQIMNCQGADLILLPEMFTFGSLMVKRPEDEVLIEKREVASRYEEVRQTMLGWAKNVQAVVLGSTVFETEGKYYNRMILAFPDGHCLYYDKRHCFRMGGENEHFVSGDQRLVFEFQGMKIAAFICYDLRFPVWSRNAEEYDLALYIANWPAARRKVWETLLKARAIENQAYVIGVNCVGTDLNGVVYAGDTMAIDARGELMGKLPEFQEGILWVNCNYASLQEFRQKFAVLEDRDTFVLNLC